MRAAARQASNEGVSRRRRLAAARVYLVCDARQGGGLERLLPAALAGGVRIVQLREKGLDDDELLPIAQRARALCADHGALLIVNDRPHVALAAGADGVHVGQGDVAAEQARALVGRELLVGLSTHSAREIDAACARAPAGERSGGPRGAVDYIGVGPVYATPTKPGRPAVGTGLVRYAAARATLPFFAIGGLDQANVGAVVAAGATRVATVRAIADAADPAAAARALRRALDAGDASYRPSDGGNAHGTQSLATR